MRVHKTVYYQDALHDDFAQAKIKAKPLPKHFKYIHKGIPYYVISCFFYYVIAIPILYIYGKLRYSYRVLGRKKLWRVHPKYGYFIYGNHTAEGDAIFAPVSLVNPRITRTVCSREAFSVPGVRWLELMVGAMPLPDTPKRTEEFIAALNYHYYRGNAVLIFPEAHIWSYCTRIRPFPDQSFTYPASLGAPVFGLCTTYEEHKFFKWRKPRPVIHISNPIYPDMSKPLGERAHLLREAVYSYLVDVSSSFDNVEYIRYLPAKKEN